MQRFRSPVVLFCVGTLVLATLSIAAMKMISISSPVIVSKSIPAGSDKTLLRENIKAAFNTQDGKGILAYLDLAFEQKKTSQRYDYFKKSFIKMTASYNSSRAPEKILAMNKLKTYVSSLPEYKESDFVIPK